MSSSGRVPGAGGGTHYPPGHPLNSMQAVTSRSRSHERSGASSTIVDSPQATIEAEQRVLELRQEVVRLENELQEQASESDGRARQVDTLEQKIEELNSARRL